MLTNKELVIATRNQGKVKEFAALFQQKGYAVKSLADFNDMPDIVEDGDTFTANALIKATVIAEVLKLPVLADDSGLCVDRLGGDPGVYSARYAGPGASDADNNRKLLDELAALPALEGEDAFASGALSAARFVCALVLVDEHGHTVASVEEACPGEILPAPQGAGGFGYDPLFYIPELGKTMAELSVDEKNEYSHRGKAIRSLWTQLP